MESPRVTTTLRRRGVWDSYAAAERYFLNKSLFAVWDKRVLDKYLEGGLKRSAGGEQAVELACAPETEGNIFGSGISEALWDLLQSPDGAQLAGCIVHVMVGDAPHVLSGKLMWSPEEAADVFGAIRPPHTCSVNRGEGHLWPLEQPRAFAQLIGEHFGWLRPGRAARL